MLLLLLASKGRICSCRIILNIILIAVRSQYSYDMTNRIFEMNEGFEVHPQ